MATNNAINSLNPIQVALGGTGAATLTAHGVLLGEGTGAVTALTAAATGSTLMGSTGADPAFTGSPSFSGSVTAGTTITATSGNIILTAGNLALPTTSSTVGQVTINSISVLHSFGTRNIFAGNAGNFTLSGVDNIGIGNTALNQLTSGASNICIGSRSQTQKITTGGQNNAIGNDSLTRLTTGNNNNCFGQAAGFGYTGAESNNILIGDSVQGTTGENNVMRLASGTGTGAGQVNQTFIGGIRGITTTAADAIAVLVSSTGQLGTVSSSLRFKENVQDMADASSPIMELRPVTFNYKTQPGKLSFGLIAEEVLPIMPELVVYNQDGEVESVKYHDIAIMLLNEVQKLSKRIEDLESK